MIIVHIYSYPLGQHIIMHSNKMMIISAGMHVLHCLYTVYIIMNYCTLLVSAVLCRCPWLSFLCLSFHPTIIVGFHHFNRFLSCDLRPDFWSPVRTELVPSPAQ